MGADSLDRAALAALTAAELARAGSAKWCRVPGALGASVAEMDFGVAESISDTLAEACRRGGFGYFPPELARRLEESCAEYQRVHYGWTVGPDRVRAVGDVLVGLETIIDRFTPPGSPLVVPTPAYMPFLTAPARLGRRVVRVPGNAAGELDLDGIAKALGAGAGLVVLCNPHNPIGRVYREPELRALAEVVERHGARVFADEIHAPLIYPGARHQCYAALGEHTERHTVTATSASKAWNIPGLKCAQLILGTEDQQAWQQIRHSASRGASNLGAEATITAYRDGGRWLAHVLDYLDENRRLLGRLVAEHLPGVRMTPPEGTYLAWLDCRDLRLPPSPGRYFLDHAGVSVADGALCGAEGFVRLNFATPAHLLDRLLAAMGASLVSRTATTRK
ncbi:MalY/PatB family protein [Amycolatopsis jiangsuensis]|uniref:cysteine-S-conjugate beta-lyase n=1 Tax=Amycolatopsis jiangsuensis TaxID=1181879 RepID=A0A840IRL7_9PSEU|nr:aminotransferase class I/II-fold pyridoxal phosphate-dependent enzyme [Amycolatopsis jiangsuensis]MBB4684085.1 cystathionine beta-lyase [Amycolatopsis jiangsuensis]